jgi:hypothetical protein
MTKNMTKKGLALGAAFALVGSALVASPAIAANEISLAVNGGTGTSTILGETFNLKATVGSLVPDSSNKDLTFLVANGSSAALTYAADAGTVDTGGTTDGTERVLVDGSAATTSSGASDYVKGDLVAGSADNTTPKAFTDNQTLSITSASATAHSVVVTAFLDADGSGTINNGEFASAAITVSFVLAADAGVAVAYSASPQLGDTTVTGKITSSVINVAQVDIANFGIQFGKYISGTKTAITAVNTYTYGTGTAGLSTTAEAVTLNSDKDALVTAALTVAAITAGTHIARAYYKASIATTPAFATIGAEVAAGASAATANATESAATITAVAGSVLATGEVKKGYTGNVNYVVAVLDADKVAVSGVVVRLTATSSVGTILVNGAAVASGSKTYEATTDSSGNATFSFTSAAATATDSVVVTSIVSQGVTIVTNGADLNWNASVFTAIDTTAGATSQASDVVRAVNAGASTVLSFMVVDQFGTAFADADYRMKAGVTGRTVTTLTDSLSDGAAAFVITDGANTTGDATVALSFEKLASSVWGASSDITAVSNRTVSYYTQTNTVAITETTVTARAALKATTAVDTRTGVATVFDASGANSNETATINGTVKNSTTAASQLGALITVSGDSSILFNVNNVYAFGSLTFFDADGAYAVNVYSNKVQANTVVTATSSNGGSDTVKVNFTGGPTNLGTALTITAPDSLSAGSTLQATIMLTDVYGNAVDTDISATDWADDSATSQAGDTSTNFSVTVTGPGLTLVDAPTATNADGMATIARLLGSNDSGTVVITVSYDQNDDGDYLDATDLVVSKSITVGAVATSATKVTVGTFSGYTAVFVKGYEGKKLSVKLAGKWSVVPSIVDSSAGYYLFKQNTGVGYTADVVVYIDGVEVKRETVVTK